MEGSMTSKYSNLSEYYDYRGRRFAERCTNCGLCLEACPVFPLTRFAHKGSGFVMEKITELLRGGEVSEEACDMVFSCTGACGKCLGACPEGLMLYAAFMPAIARIADAGGELPYLSYQLMPGHPYNIPRFLGALQAKPSETRWLRRAPSSPDQVDVVFFAGCMPSGMPHIVLEIMDILDSMGLSFAAIAGDDICCGSGAMIWGDLEGAERMGREFIDTISAFGANKTVFFCHGCYMMCLGILPRFMTVPFESHELTQFLVENLGRLPLKNPIDKVVAVHDSCAAARVGMVEPIRQLLGAIPGVRLVEMEHNRQGALCCGGLTNVNRPEISEPLRRAPLEEARATGADILATTCVGCLESFIPLEHEYPFEVRSYVDLVAESVGVRREDRFRPLVDGRDPTDVLDGARDYVDASGFTREEAEGILPEYLARFCVRGGHSAG